VTALKKFIIALILAFVLCSCGTAEPVVEEPSSENSVSASSEQEQISGGATPMVTYSITEKVCKIAEEKLITYFTENPRIPEELGISQKISNIEASENKTFEFDLTLSRGGKEITKNIRGFWVQSYGDEPNLNWGGYCLTNNGYLAICGTNQLFLINPEDFSLLDTEFELDSLKTPGFDLWINGVAYDEKTGWIVSAANGKPDMPMDEASIWKIFVFDENGKEIKTYSPTAKAPAGGWSDYTVPYVSRNCGIIEKDGENYYCFGGYFYCVNSGETFSGYKISDPYDARTKDYSVYFYHSRNISRITEENPYGEDLGYYAVLKDSKENILAFFPTGEDYIEESWDDETGKQTLTLLQRDGLRFILINSLLGKSMELDFEEGKYSLIYNYTDKNLIEHTETSADGKYSLWQAGVQGGGEAYFYEVALKNNETGEIRRIEANGTNQGTFSYEGFLKNGDFYVFNSKKLRIYNPETAEPVFDLEKNFSLENRMLCTFRRNPEDMSFIIVYLDYIEGGEYDEESWPWIAPYEIKIGYFDKDGRLLKSFGSGIKARYDHFGFEYIEMRYSEKELLFVTGGGKGFNGIEFTFDRRTETFSEVEEAE